MKLKLSDIIKNPYKLLAHFAHGKAGKMSDEKFLKIAYRAEMGKKLDLDNPVTFTEKLQWIKLYDRDPRYTTMVDKAEAKKWAGAIIGEEHIIPTIKIWDNADDIDLDTLPDSFVLKCTHDSHSAIICEDKSKFDIARAKEKLNKALKINYYYEGLQWAYKNVKPRVIAEKYMKDDADGELRDYKFFCFNGVPKILYIAQGRGKGQETVADFFDMDFNHLDMKIDHEMADVPPHKPVNFELMKKFAAELSDGVPHVRADFYEVNGQVYFGEMTFFHCGGLAPFKPEKWDYELGSWIKLPPKRFGK